MANEDYKTRLLEEYRELKDRYEKLKKYNTKQEVLEHTVIRTTKKIEEDYGNQLLKEQQHVMGGYLHILELRMTNEGIEYKD